MRTEHVTLVAGYHRPSRGQSAKAGLHAVSPQSDKLGARRSVCGAVGRFIAPVDWQPFPLAGVGRCEKCVNGLANPTEVDKTAAFGR